MALLWIRVELSLEPGPAVAVLLDFAAFNGRWRHVEGERVRGEVDEHQRVSTIGALVGAEPHRAYLCGSPGEHPREPAVDLKAEAPLLRLDLDPVRRAAGWPFAVRPGGLTRAGLIVAPLLVNSPDLG
ncbi:hypothetical protein [Lentzea sp. NPDC092896]|uniref:hypothetical protein n=1 Tax=Lentzea sp. NPDC092896 TaxID=3364127 RepID=UPI00381DAA40